MDTRTCSTSAHDRPFVRIPIILTDNDTADYDRLVLNANSPKSALGQDVPTTVEMCQTLFDIRKIRLPLLTKALHF